MEDAEDVGELADFAIQAVALFSREMTGWTPFSSTDHPPGSAGAKEHFVDINEDLREIKCSKRTKNGFVRATGMLDCKGDSLFNDIWRGTIPRKTFDPDTVEENVESEVKFVGKFVKKNPTVFLFLERSCRIWWSRGSGGEGNQVKSGSFDFRGTWMVSG